MPRQKGCVYDVPKFWDKQLQEYHCGNVMNLAPNFLTYPLLFSRETLARIQHLEIWLLIGLESFSLYCL